ncbi:tryptophan--tRNA ligase, partial [Pseudomonas aeruginosa]
PLTPELRLVAGLRARRKRLQSAERVKKTSAKPARLGIFRYDHSSVRVRLHDPPGEQLLLPLAFPAGNAAGAVSRGRLAGETA